MADPLRFQVDGEIHVNFDEEKSIILEDLQLADNSKECPNFSLEEPFKEKYIDLQKTSVLDTILENLSVPSFQKLMTTSTSSSSSSSKKLNQIALWPTVGYLVGVSLIVASFLDIKFLSSEKQEYLFPSGLFISGVTALVTSNKDMVDKLTKTIEASENRQIDNVNDLEKRLTKAIEVSENRQIDNVNEIKENIKNIEKDIKDLLVIKGNVEVLVRKH